MASTGAPEFPPPTETIVDLNNTNNNSMDTMNSWEKLLKLPPALLRNLERLNEFRVNYYDVRLISSLAEEKKDSESTPRILANKVILAMNSPYFQANLKKGKFSYHVPIPTAILEQLVTYMYTGQIPPIEDDSVMEFFRASQLLELTDVLSKCHEFITNKLKSSDFNFEMLLNNCPPDLANPIFQNIFDNFETFTTTDKYYQLTLTQLQQLLNLRKVLNLTGDIPSQKLLKGILNWVLADVKDRQTHFLPLLPNISLTEISPELMLECVVQLNSTYQNQMSTSSITESSEPVVPIPADQERSMTPVVTIVPLEYLNATGLISPSTSENNMQNNVQITSASITICNDDNNMTFTTETSFNQNEPPSSSSPNVSNNLFTPRLGSLSGKQLTSLPSPIPRHEPQCEQRPTPSRACTYPLMPTTSSIVVCTSRSTESRKRGALDNTLPVESGSQTKKLRQIDPPTPNKQNPVVPKVEDPDIVLCDGFEIGPIVQGISASHPLMLFISEEQKSIYSLRAYDFRERKSAVIIENVALDRYNYGMYLKGQTLNLVGGRNDSPDFVGSSGHACLSTTISFDKFLQIQEDKLRRIKYPKNGDPIYVSQCLKKPRSNFGTATYKSKFFAFGGHSLTNSSLRSLKSVEMFDNELNTWKLVESMSEHREHFGVATIHNSIYVAGGFKSSHSPQAINTVEEYLPEINIWNTVPSMIASGIATRIINVENVLFALHGGLQSSSERLNNYEIFDPRVGKWAPSRIPTRVRRFYRRGGAAACINGNIYSFGGYANVSGGNPIVELLDPRNEEWCIEGDLPKGGIFTSVSFMNL